MNGFVYADWCSNCCAYCAVVANPVTSVCSLCTHQIIAGDVVGKP